MKVDRAGTVEANDRVLQAPSTLYGVMKSAQPLHRHAFAESTFRFGPAQRLVGVLTLPDTRRADLPGVILLNAGLIHRVGPFRLHVELARYLAARGIACLRIDQSGIGDSDSGRDSAAAAVRADVGAALDVLAEHAGVERGVVIGICSGADDGFAAAVEESRIAGAVMLDGPAYKTPGFHAHHFAARIFDPRKWRSWWQRVRSGVDDVADFRNFPPRSVAASMLKRIAGRGAHTLFVYTGGAYLYFNHRAQFARNFGSIARDDHVALEFWPECDHTFYAVTDRERLLARVATWLESSFASPQISTTETAS